MDLMGYKISNLKQDELNMIKELEKKLDGKYLLIAYDSKEEDNDKK